MPVLAGDIRFAQSVNMADVPEGGGPPSANLLTSGASNQILPDISEETRTTGRVEIVQIHSLLRNTDTAALLGANVILADPPADPNVNITLLSLRDPFATRADIARRIESGMAVGSEWSGYLLENHYATMRSIQLLQRPGSAPPGIGRTYVLSLNEGKPSATSQRIRVKAVTVETRIFTEVFNGQAIDFEAQVSTCELFDALLYDFRGSPPTRFFTRKAESTVVRETVYNDSGMFYSAARLAEPTQPSDSWIRADNVYTQVVPNSRAEAALVDQRPTARSTVTLATSPRLVQAAITPHTQRFALNETNASLTYVMQCQPLPEPGTVHIDYWAMGQRYTLTDDGQGAITGAGAGAVDYLTGTIQITLKAVPDIGSIICLSHGSRLSYDNRSHQGASVRAPEYAWMIDADNPDDRVVPGSLSISYSSAGQVRTVTDNGTGQLTGDGSGVIDYPSRSILLRPAHMPDPGAELSIQCQLDTLAVELLSSGQPDPAGYVQLTLAQQPAAGSLSISWTTARAVSNTSGASLTTTSASKTTGVTYTIRSVPEYYEPQVTKGGVPPRVNTSPGSPPAPSGPPVPVNWPRSSV